MIEINDEVKCSGCRACMNACPVNAIYMKRTADGFSYPVVDEDKCLHCDLCEKVCHLNQKRNSIMAYEARYYAACLKNKDDMLYVSSGGAFWAIAQKIIQQKGIVYGAEQIDAYNVRHGRATTLQECMAFRRSKYLESNLDEVFQRVQQDLEDNQLVLFSGTGCQVGALKKYLRKTYENLYTCEIVCHGVPSPQMYQMYINEIEEQYHSKVKTINFRDKSAGWLHNQIEIIFENGEIIRQKSSEHLFHGAYIRGLFYRPSCSDCQYTQMPREGDITLADFWKYRGKLYQGNAQMGISLVVCSSQKGNKLFEAASDFLETEEVSRELAENSCYHLIHSPRVHKKQKEFAEMVQQYGYLYTAEIFLKKGIIERVKDKVWKIYSSITR